MKNKIQLFLITILLLVSTTAISQNIRGFYLQDVGDWLGNTTEENKILTYAQGNGFNYILFYDLGSIDWGSSTDKNKLAAFIRKARTSYGISQIGGVVEYAGYASQKIIPYNNSRSSNSEKFNVINLEFEFWVTSSISSSYCAKFLSPGGYLCNKSGAWSFAWKQLRAIDDLCIANGLISEMYLGWPELSQMQQIASRADRILLSAYRPTDSDIYRVSTQRMKDIASIGGTTKVITLLSSESAFMGPWLRTHPQTRPYQTIKSALDAETGSFKNNISLQGYQWFTYRYMPKTIVNTCIPPAVPTISYSGSLVLNPGQSITFNSSGIGGHLWSNGATTQSITVNAAGTYWVKNFNGTNCYSTSDNVKVTMNACIPPPIPSITINGSTVIYPGESTMLISDSAEGYLWSTGEHTQSIIVTNSGTYTVRNYNGPGCSSVSLPVNIIMGTTTDIYNFNYEKEYFYMYPNPATDNFNVRINNNQNSKISLNLMDLSGRIIVHKEYSDLIGENIINFNIDNISKGVYIFSMINENQIHTSKIIVN